MNFTKEHKVIQKSLLVAAKFGFLRKETFWNFLTSPNVSYKYDLWNYLMGTGYLTKYDRVGVAENYYCLSKKGISLLKDQGLEIVCRAHPLHFEHDEIVATFALACEKAQLIHDNWSTDRMLRHYLLQDQIQKLGRALDKLPDLLFDLNIENLKIECALEVERTRKSKTRYDSFVLSYAKDKNIGFVLVAYNDIYVLKSIQDSIRRLGYPQTARPIAFCRIKDLLEYPSEFEIEISGHKIKFDQYIKNFRQIVNKTPEDLNTKKSVLNSGDSKAAA